MLITKDLVAISCQLSKINCSNPFQNLIFLTISQKNHFVNFW